MGGELVPIFMIVIVVGFYVGRWYAEIRRSQFDRKRNWYQRQDYRRVKLEKPPRLWR